MQQYHERREVLSCMYVHICVWAYRFYLFLHRYRSPYSMLLGEIAKTEKPKTGVRWVDGPLVVWKVWAKSVVFVFCFFFFFFSLLAAFLGWVETWSKKFVWANSNPFLWFFFYLVFLWSYWVVVFLPSFFLFFVSIIYYYYYYYHDNYITILINL